MFSWFLRQNFHGLKVTQFPILNASALLWENLKHVVAVTVLSFDAWSTCLALSWSVKFTEWTHFSWWTPTSFNVNHSEANIPFVATILKPYCINLRGSMVISPEWIISPIFKSAQKVAAVNCRISPLLSFSPSMFDAPPSGRKKVLGVVLTLRKKGILLLEPRKKINNRRTKNNAWENPYEILTPYA